MLVPIPAQVNIRSFPIVAKATGTAITTGVVNYYLIANTGANAGKWYQDSDATWQAAESLAKAMTFKGGAVWQVTPKADAFINGVEYTEYAKESGALHIPVERDFRCVYVIATDSAGKVAVPDTQKVDTIAISGDSVAADNLETMLDGTGGNVLSLGRLVVLHNDTTAAVHIRNTSGNLGAKGLYIQSEGDDAIDLEGAYSGMNIVGKNEQGIRIYSQQAQGLMIQGNSQGVDIIGNTEEGIRVVGGTADILADITGDITTVSGNDLSNLDAHVSSRSSHPEPNLTNLDVKVSTRSTFAGGAVASVTDVTNITDAITALWTATKKWLRLGYRKDAAIASDYAAELADINVDTGTGTGAYTNLTHSQEAIEGSVASSTPDGYEPDIATRVIGSDEGGGVADLAARDEVRMITGEDSSDGLEVHLVRSASPTDLRPSVLRIRGYYSGGATHQIIVRIYNYQTSSYEEHGRMMDRSGGFDYTFPMTLANHNAVDGEMDASLKHNVASYIAPHRLYLDYVSFEKRATTSELETSVAAIKAQTDQLNFVLDDVKARLNVTPPTAIEVREEIDSNSTKLDVAVGTRATDAGVWAVGTRTLTAVPAGTALQTTQVEIKAVTDKLDTTIEEIP